MRLFYFLSLFITLAGCQTKKSDVPRIAFADAFEDNTLARARQGFYDALKDSGFSEEKKNIELLYRNAQGNIPTLTQIIQYFIDTYGVRASGDPPNKIASYLVPIVAILLGTGFLVRALQLWKKQSQTESAVPASEAMRVGETDKERTAHLQAGLIRSMPRPQIRTARQGSIRSRCTRHSFRNTYGARRAAKRDRKSTRLNSSHRT